MNSCWSYIELLGPEELIHLQEKRLRSLVQYLDQGSPYYHKKFKEYGFEPNNLKGLNDLKKLPFTTKEDLIKDVIEGKSPVFYKNLFVDKPENILRWNKTSGTTGTPVRIADTLWDWNAYAELSAEALYAMGVRRSDTAIVPFGYGPFIAFWLYIAGLEKIGTAFIPSGGLDAGGRIGLLKEFRVTVLICTPSYALHLGEVARTTGDDLGTDTNIRLVIVTGEPTLPSARKQINEIWKAEKRDRLGCAEAGGIAFECPLCSGIYHIQEGFLIPEVIDFKTGDPVGPGEEGELVVTPLYRRGMPVLRFKTGNIVRLADRRRWNCGRNYLSLEEGETGAVVRRSDMLTKVRGVLVNPEDIGRVLKEFKELGESFQIILEKLNQLDEVTVKVESQPQDDLKRRARLVKLLEEALKRKLMIRVKVELLPIGGLKADGNKFKRVLDLRKGIQDGNRE